LKNRYLYTFYKKTPSVGGGIFSDALKGRKGEKEIGILNLSLGPKVQRRENVGGSLKTPGPQMLGI